jgi:hypothetical protein
MVKQIKPRCKTPKCITGAVVSYLVTQSFNEATSFDYEVQQSVDLNSKNTANLKNKDLAVLQIIQIAKRYNVEVVL